MFFTRVSILLVFIFFLQNPFFSYANKLPIPNSPVDNISVYNKFSNTNLPSQNPDPSTPEPRKGSTFGRGNTIATGLILVITMINIIVYKLRELQEANLAEELNSSSSLRSEQSCRRFSLSEILLATNNFSEKLVLGRGGFGKVYKGFIDNGTVTVAIKRLNHMSNQGAREFWNEIEMLSKFRHSHLVSLIGYCNIGKEMVIVYEYMVQGTLADHLHKNGTEGSSGNSTLSWVQRLKICIGAARGLDYLHTGTGVIDRVIHRDVKTSNILLDQNWEARISDFGMSKIGPANTSVTHVNTNIKGTFGYVDPEYFLTHKLTRKSDVYSFGVVLFEVLCGRPVIDPRLNNEQRALAGWAQQNVREGTLDQIIDPSLTGQILPGSLKTFAQTADQCLHMFSKERPTMAEVVVSLELALALQESNQENPNSLTEQEGIIDLNNDLHQDEQMSEITQLGDARNEHPRAKRIRKRELLRQAFRGMARVISGNKLRKKAKRSSEQFDANIKGEDETLRNKQIDAKGKSIQTNINKWSTLVNKQIDDAKGESSISKEEEETSLISTWSKEEKVNRIFQHFDANRDGGLNREEMAALFVAMNPSFTGSDDQLTAIVDLFFLGYDEYIDGYRGLTFDGLWQIYHTSTVGPDADLKALGINIEQEVQRAGVDKDKYTQLINTFN